MIDHIEKSYMKILNNVLDNGIEKTDRTGVGTKSIFGMVFKHDCRLGFPILTSKKILFKNVVTELLWWLHGRTDLHYLHQFGLKYWDENYEASSRTDGTVGKAYGYQFRNFNGVDQLFELMQQLKSNPDSRRLLLNLWNVSDLDEMLLPPCPYGFQLNVTTEGELDLLWIQRSADVFLGLPYDISIYGLLLHLFAKGYGYKPRYLIGQLGDTHIYKTHYTACEEHRCRTPNHLPYLELTDSLFLINNEIINIPEHSQISLQDYQPLPLIKAPMAV